MAWQTKTFTWETGKGYTLELALSENHVDKINNYSEVSYYLTLKSGSSNRFQCDVTCTLTMNGALVEKKTKNKFLDYNSTWDFMSGTVRQIWHNEDGSLNMPIVVSIDTTDTNDWAPPDNTFTEYWELTKIARASEISIAAATTLGSPCRITWTPCSKSFYYKLVFSLGEWSYTTDPIHPNKTSATTYNAYTLPLEALAPLITKSRTETMGVVLTTYADSSCKTVVGSDDASFTVTVPENEYTMPTVTMELKPVQPAVMPEASPLYGFYLQGISRVNATLRATPKLETTIKSYSLIVDEVSTTAATGALETNPVVNIGEIKVVGTATDERTIAGSVEDTITVLPYSKPRLSATAYRCLSDGSQSDTGTQLKIYPVATFAPVLVDDLPQNSCSISWRYRAEGEVFPDNYTEWVDGALLDVGSLAVDKAYEVEIRAEDDAGQTVSVLVSIPTESVYMHKPPGGEGLGLGGYCKNGGLDVHWDIRGRKAINGLYMRKVDTGNNVFQLEPKYGMTNTPRRTFFIFGMCNTTPVFGMLAAPGYGTCTWTGNGNVTATVADGVISITLPAARTNPLTVISADPFEIAEE
ncbi:MAG: hypothetical protein IKA47_12480 [Oscillospiraceae bacterium]|nr:hypothetical protein [Oscillospiraceae bacterium]